MGACGGRCVAHPESETVAKLLWMISIQTNSCIKSRLHYRMLARSSGSRGEAGKKLVLLPGAAHFHQDTQANYTKKGDNYKPGRIPEVRVDFF